MDTNLSEEFFEGLGIDMCAICLVPRDGQQAVFVRPGHRLLTGKWTEPIVDGSFCELPMCNGCWDSWRKYPKQTNRCFDAWIKRQLEDLVGT